MIRQLMEEMRREAGLEEMHVPTKEQQQARKVVVGEVKKLLRQAGFDGPKTHRYGDSYSLALTNDTLPKLKAFVQTFARLAAKHKMGHSTQDAGATHEWKNYDMGLTISMRQQTDRKTQRKTAVVFIGD